MKFQSLAEEPNDIPWWNYQKNCLAVVSIPDDESQGVVIWYVGGRLSDEIEENGRFLEDLDLYSHEGMTGIMVWEGNYKYIDSADKYDDPTGWVAFGEFREPTEDEWTSIMKNECPWDERDWYIH